MNMKNVPEVKVGIVAGSTDWMPLEIAVSNRKKLVETYKAKYGEDGIYECSVCITDNEVSIKRVMREIGRAECNAVCLYYANYGPESAGTLFAREFDGPVMFCAAAEEGEGPYFRERKDALSGFINACYALKLRKTDVYIPDRPCGTYRECADRIREFIPVARTLTAVKDLKVISFGPRPSSYLASSAPGYLLYDMGAEISEYSELELLDSYKKHEGDRRVDRIVSEMEQELGAVKDPGILPSLARYELTLEDWIRNHKGDRKYVTLTSACWPAFPVNFGFVPCYVNSRLAGRGYPVACETDIYGAVSAYIGQCVSNDAAAVLNINNNIPSAIYEKEIRNREFAGKRYGIGDLFLGYHCGVTASRKLTKARLDDHFVNRQLIGEGQSKGTIQGTILPGAVTVFRLQGMRDGKRRAYVCQGQILPVSMETYGGQGIIAVPGMERFIRNVILEKQYPNHCIVIFGHHGRELISIFRQIGIEEIDFNHPENVPYENENVFSTHPDWY